MDQEHLDMLISSPCIFFSGQQWDIAVGQPQVAFVTCVTLNCDNAFSLSGTIHTALTKLLQLPIGRQYRQHLAKDISLAASVIADVTMPTVGDADEALG